MFVSLSPNSSLVFFLLSNPLRLDPGQLLPLVFSLSDCQFNWIYKTVFNYLFSSDAASNLQSSLIKIYLKVLQQRYNTALPLKYRGKFKLSSRKITLKLYSSVNVLSYTVSLVKIPLCSLPDMDAGRMACPTSPCWSRLWSNCPVRTWLAGR